MENRTPRAPIVLAAVLSLIMLTTWRWHTVVFQTKPASISSDEAWENIKDAYPMPNDIQQVSKISTDSVEALVDANPFSQKRHSVSPTGGAEGEKNGGATTEPGTPVLIYRGRINLGKRQRA